jgi:hypothetical protein
LETDCFLVIGGVLMMKPPGWVAGEGRARAWNLQNAPAVARAVKASAETAERAAARAESAAKARRSIERVTVTEHDQAGRIRAFEKRTIEEDAE